MPAAKTPAQWVDPFIDSAGSRWIFFSSACRPFGMVNLSPDTDIAGAWGSSYLYHSETICGFSHVHAWQLAGVAVMPVCGDHPGGPCADAYRSRFTHGDEVCEAGYHAVSLPDHGVRAELTSTPRVGLHRYTFAQTGQATVLFNLGGTLGPGVMSDARVAQTGECELTGHVVNAPTRRRPKEAVIHFVAQFSKPLAGFDGWQGEQRLVAGPMQGNGDSILPAQRRRGAEESTQNERTGCQSPLRPFLRASARVLVFFPPFVGLAHVPPATASVTRQRRTFLPARFPPATSASTHNPRICRRLPHFRQPKVGQTFLSAHFPATKAPTDYALFTELASTHSPELASTHSQTGTACFPRRGAEESTQSERIGYQRPLRPFLRASAPPRESWGPSSIRRPRVQSDHRWQVLIWETKTGRQECLPHLGQPRD